MTTSESGDAPGYQWRKSSVSVATGACVELAPHDEDRIALRHSRSPEIVMLFTRAEIRAFLDGGIAGEFDDLAGPPQA